MLNKIYNTCKWQCTFTLYISKWKELYVIHLGALQIFLSVYVRLALGIHINLFPYLLRMSLEFAWTLVHLSLNPRNIWKGTYNNSNNNNSNISNLIETFSTTQEASSVKLFSFFFIFSVRILLIILVNPSIHFLLLPSAFRSIIIFEILSSSNIYKKKPIFSQWSNQHRFRYYELKNYSLNKWTEKN